MYLFTKSRGSAVGKVASKQSSSTGKAKNVHLSISSRQSLRPTQPLIQYMQGAISQGVEQPGREADHAPQTSAEAKRK
jgi:hypothetical protein